MFGKLIIERVKMNPTSEDLITQLRETKRKLNDLPLQRPPAISTHLMAQVNENLTKLTNANAHANSWKIGFTRQVENSKDIGDKHAVLVEKYVLSLNQSETMPDWKPNVMT